MARPVIVTDPMIGSQVKQGVLARCEGIDAPERARRAVRRTMRATLKVLS
jgi:hypothetical protein